MSLCFLLLQLLFLEGVLSLCPESFERHGDSCYKVMGLKASWIEAKLYCKVMGSDLLVIDSQGEEKLIDGILKRLHGSIAPEQYWIDGADFMSEGEWRWVRQNGNSEILTGYTNWSPGQPDNNGNKENCLEIRYTFGVKWNDYWCNYQQNFICEASTDAFSQIIG